MAAEPLLNGVVVVPLGGMRYRTLLGALLRAAGAEVRANLPTQHHNAREGTERCVVLVEKDADHAAVAGDLARAKRRGVDVASQDWAKHCLLLQRLLLPVPAAYLYLYKPSLGRM